MASHNPFQFEVSPELREALRQLDRFPKLLLRHSDWQPFCDDLAQVLSQWDAEGRSALCEEAAVVVLSRIFLAQQSSMRTTGLMIRRVPAGPGPFMDRLIQACDGESQRFLFLAALHFDRPDIVNVLRKSGTPHHDVWLLNSMEFSAGEDLARLHLAALKSSIPVLNITRSLISRAWAHGASSQILEYAQGLPAGAALELDRELSAMFQRVTDRADIPAGFDSLLQRLDDRRRVEAVFLPVDAMRAP